MDPGDVKAALLISHRLTHKVAERVDHQGSAHDKQQVGCRQVSPPLNLKMGPQRFAKKHNAWLDVAVRRRRATQGGLSAGVWLSARMLGYA